MSRLEKTFRCGAVEASVWGKSEEHNGEIVKRYTVKIQRSYKDDQGQWQSTAVFPVDDLPKVSIVAQEAFKYLRVKEQDNFEKAEKGSA